MQNNPRPTYLGPGKSSGGETPKATSKLPPKEFTEKWLQALTLSAAMPAAQKIKPLLACVDGLSQYQCQEDRKVLAKQLWDFASSEGLSPLLQIMPFAKGEWSFEEEERFVFERVHQEACESLEQWHVALGLEGVRIPLIGIVNQSDWTNFLRQELVRHGRTLSMTAMPTGSMLRVPCFGIWNENQWSIQFENPDWLKLQIEARFSVQRPSYQDLEESFLWGMMTAQESLLAKAATPSGTASLHTDWVSSVERLKPLHLHVFESKPSKFVPVFQRCWAAVWPTIYREQNCLKGSCDLNEIRTELEFCFRTQPRLTVWMFVFAKLVCLMQIGSGLGISGDYRDE